MVMYILLFSVLCLTTARELYQKQYIQLWGPHGSVSFNTEVCLPLLLLLFLGIFRETDVGFDAQNYYSNYWLRTELLTWGQLLRNFTMDNGFYLTLKLISLVTEDWWMARAILFVLTILPYYYAIRKYVMYPSLALIIFLGNSMLGLSFGILRQALAGAVTVIAYNRFRNGFWFKCLAYILLAVTIHKSAFLCLFMLALYFMDTKNFSVTKMTAISFAVYGLAYAVIPWLTRYYRRGEYYGIAASNGGYGKLLWIVTVIALIMHLFRITKTAHDKELSYLFNLSCATLFVQIEALQWSLITRSSTFFSFYWCILIPKLIEKLPRDKRFVYASIVVVLFGFMFFYQFEEVDRFVMHCF